MSVEAAGFLQAVTHLPAGGRMVLYGVEWDDYERLLTNLSDSSALRVNYNHGRLEIMSPSAKHEKYKTLLHDFVLILGDELAVDLASFGSVTLKRPSVGQGVEADDCFYVDNATEAIRRGQIDLEVDPPPDLVIEVDLTHDSAAKFAIYASLGVREIWRHDGRHLSIFELTDGQYLEVEHSHAFPLISSRQIEAFIEDTEVSGTYRARQNLRTLVRADKP